MLVTTALAAQIGAALQGGIAESPAYRVDGVIDVVHAVVPIEQTDLLCWLDLEMTGLDPSEHVIVEVATLLTDSKLEIVAEAPLN